MQSNNRLQKCKTRKRGCKGAKVFYQYDTAIIKHSLINLIRNLIVKFNSFSYNREETFNHGIKCLELDLANFTSIHEFSSKVISKERKLDYLICNAGIGWDSDHPKITSDGQVFEYFELILTVYSKYKYESLVFKY